MAVVSGSYRLHVLGVPVDALDMRGTVAWVAERVRTREPGTHLCVNAANVVRARDDSEYRSMLEQGSVIGADGQSMVWASRLLGRPVPERIAGIDLMEQILERSKAEGWRVYLLGARDFVVQRLGEQLRADGVSVAGVHHGYFRPEDEEALLEEIRLSNADILFVGMPSPVKERFIVEQTVKAGVPVCIGVGGSFDVLAGELRRAPRILQRLGLEWLFRLLQEPRRLFFRYAVTNTRFCALVIRAVFQRGRDPGRA